MVSARVLVVDDHPMYAESISRLLQAEPDFDVVGVAATSSDAIRAAQELHPDVAIVDYQLPDGDGTATARAIHDVSPATTVLLLTGVDDTTVAAAALQAGCAGCLSKTTPGGELVRSVRVAVARLQNEYLARLSHEFRTPLAGILGFARLLAHQPPDAPGKVQELALEIERSGMQLQRIVEILELTASSASGRFQVQPVDVHAETVIADTVERWRPRLDARHPLIAWINQPTGVVHADPRWLARALDEMIDNAIKFSPDGSDVTVTATPSVVQGIRMLEFTVTDHGTGFSPQAGSAAFDEFFQADASDTRQFNGLGLGLSLVRSVALAHGGAVSYRAAVPHGSAVSVAIPLVP